MRRELLTAAVLFLAALPVCAQRGGFRTAPRGPILMRPHAGAGFRGGFGFRSGFGFGGHTRVRIINPRRFQHHRPFFRPGFVPFVSYPYYPLGFYDSFSYTAQQPVYVDRNTRLASEVYRLQAEVDQLREEQRLRAEQEEYTRPAPLAAPAPPARLAPETPAPAAVLAYRDGRKVEVRNYAIVGETLWILSEQRARKVPLADLDLEATRRANEERGIEFVVPSTRSRPAH